LPYIKQERRPDLDPLLEPLWNELSAGKTLDEMKGDVNYCFTKILITMLKKFGMGYSNLSAIRAIPQDVHDEFTKQFMRPYEDKKKRENGEVKPLE